MSTLTQRIVLFAIGLIEYAIAFDPAPDVAAKAEELRATLKTSNDSLTNAVRQNSNPPA